jgi:hypothetical protein
LFSHAFRRHRGALPKSPKRWSQSDRLLQSERREQLPTGWGLASGPIDPGNDCAPPHSAFGKSERSRDRGRAPATSPKQVACLRHAAESPAAPQPLRECGCSANQAEQNATRSRIQQSVPMRRCGRLFVPRNCATAFNRCRLRHFAQRKPPANHKFSPSPHYSPIKSPGACYRLQTR